MTTECGVIAGEQVQQQQSESREAIDLDQRYRPIGIPAVSASAMFTHKDVKPAHHHQFFEFED